MTKKHRMILSLFLIAALVVLAASPVTAQEKAEDNMQLVIEKMRADKKLLVAENMKLTENEGKQFWPLYDRFQDELFLLRSRTLKMIGDYKDSFEKLDNNTARRLLDDYLATETLRLKLHQVYLPKFRKILPDVKVVRYYQIENKIQAALMYEAARTIPLAKAKE
ncbi:MAG: hypothetical protein ABFD98_10250 [Syntrophobacteraceae bacterium]|nr:hypothetical protein [Desulfobacteraceae bacterium]